MIPLNSQLSEIESIYNNHVERIRRLIELEYKEEAIILTVTIFEVFFRDLFRITNELWFPHIAGSIDCLPIPKNIEAKKEIRNYLQKIKAYNKFLGNYYVFQVHNVDATRFSIYNTLFDDKDKLNYLNFQNLSDDNGVRKAYKIFFNIDLMMLLDPDDKISLQKWEKLSTMFKERHDIVHKGKVTEFSKEDITELLNSLDFLKKTLMAKILAPYAGSIT